MDTRTESGNHCLYFRVGIYFIQPCLFHIQYFAAQRQDCLCGTASCRFGAASCGIPLHDINFTVCRIFIGTVRQFSRQAHSFQSGFPSRQIPGFSCGIPCPLRQDRFFTDYLRHGRILFQKVSKLFADNTVHCPPGFGISKFLFRLSLKLGVLNFHADNGSQPFPDIFAAQIRLVFL